MGHTAPASRSLPFESSLGGTGQAGACQGQPLPGHRAKTGSISQSCLQSRHTIKSILSPDFAWPLSSK